MGWRDGDVSVVTVYVRRGTACVCMCLLGQGAVVQWRLLLLQFDIAESTRTRRLGAPQFGWQTEETNCKADQLRTTQLSCHTKRRRHISHLRTACCGLVKKSTGLNNLLPLVEARKTKTKAKCAFNFHVTHRDKGKNAASLNLVGLCLTQPEKTSKIKHRKHAWATRRQRIDPISQWITSFVSSHAIQT